MRMTRRAVAAVALGAMAIASLAACRVEQGTALFVGKTRVTEEQVDQIVESLPQQADTAIGAYRSLTVDALAVTELGKLVSADTGNRPDADAAENQRQFWMQQGVSSNREFIDLMGEAEGYRVMLMDGAEPVTPSDADVDAMAAAYEDHSGMALTDSQKAAITADPDDPQWQEAFGSREQVESYVNLWEQNFGNLKQLADYVDEYDVTVNPRYGDSFIVVSRGSQNEPVLTLPLES